MDFELEAVWVLPKDLPLIAQGQPRVPRVPPMGWKTEENSAMGFFFRQDDRHTTKQVLLPSAGRRASLRNAAGHQVQHTHRLDQM